MRFSVEISTKYCLLKACRITIFAAKQQRMHSLEEKLAAFSRLLQIMDELREQCPWDMKQTLESLRHLTIEETYELSCRVIERKSKKNWVTYCFISFFMRE
jgi:uncharacterized protein YabN with tetrapyrrole methylase and pyrophosphatase domain